MQNKYRQANEEMEMSNFEIFDIEKPDIRKLKTIQASSK